MPFPRLPSPSTSFQVAPFSMLYISVVTLVLLNMLIAILTEYFETMKEEERALSGQP